VLAGVLVAEITGLAIARSIVPSVLVSAPASGPMSPSSLSIGRLRDDVARVAPSTSGRDVADPGRDPRSLLAAIARSRPVPAAGPGVAVPRTPAKAPPATAPAKAPAARYHGRNHVWIPALNISRSVGSFPCSRSSAPDNHLYRWGCSGRNNVYLLGHAWGVFKPLHDAYVRGRLHKGMKVVYADGGGHVHTYSVTWWRLVAPTTAASWAWATQSRPSMTLQTCVGSRSQYRLMVRLVRVG
jgi:hypothetical protein